VLRQLKFTKRALDGLPPAGDKREIEYSDLDVAGLRLVVNRLGRKAWLLRYTFRGDKRAMKLGEYPHMDIAEARLVSQEMRAQAARGINPQTERVVAQTPKSMTLTDFMDRHYLPHAKSLKSYGDCVSRWRHHLKPVFGKTLLVDIKTHEIQRFHDRKKIELSAGTANRVLALLKRALNLALLWEVGDLQKNPVRGVRMHQENNARQRYLAGDELRRFMTALDNEPNKTAAAVIRFLLATGVRRMEALTAKFSDMKLDEGTWRLTKTKNGRARVVYLNEVALGIVKDQRKASPWDWVFPATSGKDAHYVDPKKAFQRVLAEAGISGDGIVLHSLRHSFATLVAQYYPLHIAGNLLGHRSQATTAIYAHAQSHQLREASARVAAAMTDAVRPQA
jgi:integrase